MGNSVSGGLDSMQSVWRQVPLRTDGPLRKMLLANVLAALVLVRRMASGSRFHGKSEWRWYERRVGRQ